MSKVAVCQCIRCEKYEDDLVDGLCVECEEKVKMYGDDDNQVEWDYWKDEMDNLLSDDLVDDYDDWRDDYIDDIYEDDYDPYPDFY